MLLLFSSSSSCVAPRPLISAAAVFNGNDPIPISYNHDVYTYYIPIYIIVYVYTRRVPICTI